MNNENKNLSRNRKRIIERKIEMDDRMKLLLNKIESEKKNKSFDNTKQLQIELVKIKYANNPSKLQSALKELDKTHVNKKLLEIKNETLVDFTGGFQLVGELSFGDHIRQTHIRFRNINDYESYINAIDQDCESEDAIFNGYIYKINTPQFNLVNRSQYGNGCDFKHESIEYRGIKC